MQGPTVDGAAGPLPPGHMPLTDGGGSGSAQPLPPGHPPLKQ
jgi:hypothetical protein